MNTKKNFDIFGGDYLDENKRLVVNNRILLLVLGTLLLFILMLSVFAFKLYISKQVAVFLPPYKIEVNYQDANQDYYKVWAEWAVSLISNVDDRDVTEKINSVVRFFDQESLAKSSEFLKNYINSIKTNKIEQSFRFRNQDTVVELNQKNSGNKAKVVITGVATQKIGNLVKRERECSYSIGFSFFRQTIFFRYISTNCFDGRTLTSKVDENKDIIIKNIEDGKKTKQNFTDPEKINKKEVINDPNVDDTLKDLR
ncbi:hypothetical protein CQA57_07105 [Helicobacter anseris]|uniref:Uncharacterized protein n=1 Tax=Helicobacter anseris TaxID=375926 RepID=A0A3D8J639_9HELI|nr:TraE/TraK family type IV conjugative transfer system protein [Helicobacter anseris]RDU72364.1 hypothetical protein CQA57_07105 [Helicobacter anseris]